MSLRGWLTTYARRFIYFFRGFVTTI